MDNSGYFLECVERVGDDDDVLLQEGAGCHVGMVLRGDFDIVDQPVDVH